jgi:hypothetical protein
VKHLSGTLLILQVPGLTRLEKLARNKHSSLLQTFVNHGQKSFITLGPGQMLPSIGQINLFRFLFQKLERIRTYVRPLGWSARCQSHKAFFLHHWQQVKIIGKEWGPTTLGIMTFSIMAFSIMAFSIMTLSIVTFKIATLSIIVLRILTLNINIFSIMTFTILAFSILTFSIMTFSLMTVIDAIPFLA